MSSDVLRHYEVMILFGGDLTEDAVKKEIDLIKQEITTHEGEVLFEDFWGKRKLAYLVQKQEAGFYHVILFRIPASFAPLLEKELRINKKILRHLITMTPSEYQPITAGEVEATEERYVAEMRTKKSAGRGGRRPSATAAPAPAPIPKEVEKASEDTAEERAKKLDKILSSDLNI